MAAIEREQDTDAFYVVNGWKVGERVALRSDPDRTGVLVRKAATFWVDRLTKPPLVRFDGRVDSNEVPWFDLVRSDKGWS